MVQGETVHSSDVSSITLKFSTVSNVVKLHISADGMSSHPNYVDGRSQSLDNINKV